MRKELQWNDIVTAFCSAGVKSPSKKKTGLSKTSIQNYFNFYRFCAKYMRFLRVRTTYTQIIREMKALENYFKSNTVAKARWSDFISE